MFAKTIIDSDAFLDMPLSTQALYFHLSMRADDEGFINNPKKIQRMIGASDDDLRVLMAKNFIIPFESGIVVIKHWKIHNYIQKDRFKPTLYQEEKSQLDVKDNKAYTLSKMETVEGIECIQDGYIPDTQVRLGKDRKGKDRKGKDSVRETTPSLFQRLAPEYQLSDSVIDKLSEWMMYKIERKEPYKEMGMKSLLRQVENNVNKYGEKAVCNLIDECMASNWKGIIFERLAKEQTKSRGGRLDWIDSIDVEVGDGF